MRGKIDLPGAPRRLAFALLVWVLLPLVGEGTAALAGGSAEAIKLSGVVAGFVTIVAWPIMFAYVESRRRR